LAPTGAVLDCREDAPQSCGNHAVIGSWIAGGAACGIGMREDVSPITKNTSRFLPHAILG
jgi:glutathionylspermidine synthase